MTCNLDFQERWEQLKVIDDGKNGLVEALLNEVGKLSEKLGDIEMQLEREKDTSSMYHRRFRATDMELKDKQKEMDCNTFVSVLIDGDCMNFLDDLVKNTEVGGQEAAQLLRACVLEYLRHDLPELQHDLEIMVRVYGNMSGLNKMYCDSYTLEQREDFGRFVRGFNMGHPLCDFIDAGNGKECSDDKIREVFKLHVGDLHCKHIMFGGSADNGYARMLGPYAGNETMNKRITMLEGPLFAQELSRLVKKFKTTSFPKVFRDTKISPRTGSFSAHSPNDTISKPPTWASKIGIRPAVPVTVPEHSPTSDRRLSETENPVSRNSKGQDPIPRNSKGQRVDISLKFNQNLVGGIKGRKYCNNYHLLGECPYYGEYGCRHEHGDRLKGAQLNTLRYIARLTPCKAGLACDDPECFWGHKCVHGNCNVVDCRFSSDMHSVDTKVASR